MRAVSPPLDGDDPFVEVDQGWSLERLRWRIDDLRDRPDRIFGLLAAVIAAGLAVWWLSSTAPTAPPAEASLPLATPLPAAPPAAATTSVVVHVAGAVARPGVYTMPAGSRIDDALEVAGGLEPDGELREVNLAATIVDGSRIYVPLVGEDVPPVSVGVEPSGAGDGDAEQIDLNRATADQLDELPGVGPATAAAIVGYREEHGDFRVVDDLLNVGGIGPAKLEQLRSLAVVR